MEVIGILAYGSLIEDPGQAILDLLVRRIDTTTPFPVEFARKSSSRDNGPTLIPFTHGVPVKAQILVLRAETTVVKAANILYQRETRQTHRNYNRPSDDEITDNTVLVDSLNNFEDVQTVLYTRIGSNIQDLTPIHLAELAIQSARAKAGLKRLDGINYLMAAKRNGIKTVLTEDYELQILELTDTEDLETAYQHCRINFVKLNVSLFIPYLVKLVEGLNFPWDRIDNLFREKLKERKLLANGNTITVEATIFDVIVEAKKNNSTAIGYLDFLNRLFQELTHNLTASEIQYLQSNLTNLLTKFDKGYWGYVAEIATLNNLIKSKTYTLTGCEVQLPGTKPIDFKLHVIDRNIDIFVEILSIHLDSDRIANTHELMKKFLADRISKKIAAKNMDVQKFPNLYLIPILWGDKKAVEQYSSFFKTNSLNIPNVIEPLSYLTYSDGSSYYEHYFKTISNLFTETKS
jgi:hypothetical protein